MCDYSLEMYRTRPAREGERYVTTRFGSGSIGLSAPGDELTPVCVQCDTRLRLEGIPKDTQERLGVGAVEEVTFVRLDKGPWRDGVRFRPAWKSRCSSSHSVSMRWSHRFSRIRRIRSVFPPRSDIDYRFDAPSPLR